MPTEPFRAIVDSSPHGVVLVDGRGTIVLVNRETERMFGYGRDELVGASLDVLVPHGSREAHGPLQKDFIANPQTRAMGAGRDLSGRRRDGTEVAVEIGLSSIETDQGRFVLASVTDITERKRVELQLRASEERFRQVAENIKEALVVLELPTYRALYLSRMWADIWGRSVEDAYRNPRIWIDSVHPDDRTAVLASQDAVEHGQPGVAAFRVIRPDGSMRWARSRAFPVLDENHHPYRVVGLVEDITEVRRTEAQLVQAQKMEAVGRLAGGIAHDFNNLLTVIFGYSDLVLEELGLAHPSTGDVRQIRAAAQSAESLTRQLLAFSRQQILQPRSLDLNEVLGRVDALLRRVIGEDIVLLMKLTTPLARVSADPGQIEQVIMNIAVNARDAMPRGGRLTIETANVELDERFAAQHPGGSAGAHVMIAVSDTGTGMDEATQKRVFEPFFTTKGIGKGTGLGLATVYGIVKQSHGSIWVYSEPGQGATFKIYLPVTTAAPAEPATMDVEPVSLAGTETVLLVEDQTETRSVIRETLYRRGYAVIDAANGVEAVEKARQHKDPIHLLLTDVVMPEMSGRRVAEILDAERPGIRVIYMSGYTDDAIVHHGILDAGLAFMQKPFTAEALLRKVREVLEAPSPPAR